MDVLSSQSTVAGYKGVLIGARARQVPADAHDGGRQHLAGEGFVIGAGVAGLQAIATARRLGGVVSAFDVRPAAREQVLSLGATFVANDLVSDRRRAPAATRARRRRRAIEDTRRDRAHIKDQDLVVTTAQIPGKPRRR
jgi:NAD(P) transhydrogenase subunit alpha